MISLQCPSCKKVRPVPESVLGKEVRCNDCQHVFVVSDAGPGLKLLDETPMEAHPAGPQPASDTAPLIRFQCKCGSEIIMAQQFGGRKARCKSCGGTVTVPAGAVGAGSSTARPGAPDVPSRRARRVRKLGGIFLLLVCLGAAGFGGYYLLGVAKGHGGGGGGDGPRSRDWGNPTPDTGMSEGRPVAPTPVVGERAASMIPVQRRPTSEGTPRISDLDKEAAKLAVQFFDPTKIGESYYTCHVQTSRDPKCPNKGRLLIELRKVSMEVDPSEVTEAEQLNGIEWHGNATLQAGLARFCMLADLPSPMFGGGYAPGRAPDKTWSPWSDRMTIQVSLLKAKGKWTVNLVGWVPGHSVWDHDSTFERVDPAAIAKIGYSEASVPTPLPNAAPSARPKSRRP